MQRNGLWVSLCGLGIAIGALGAAVILSGSSRAVAEQTVWLALEDAISGEWTGRVFGEAFPEDVPLIVTLMMVEDGAVVGEFTIPDGTAAFKGQFDAETNTLTGSVVTEDAHWALSLTLDGDTLTGGATEANSGLAAKLELERDDEDD